MSPARSQRPRPFTVRRLLALVVAVVCGWVTYALYGEAAQDHAALARVAQLQAADSALQAQIAQRSMEIAEAQSTTWLEDQARKLGYHLPGEQVYVLDPGGTSPATGGLNAVPPTFSPTPVPTPTPTATPTPTPTATPAATSPGTPSASATPAPSPTPTP